MMASDWIMVILHPFSGSL